MFNRIQNIESQPRLEAGSMRLLWLEMIIFPVFTDCYCIHGLALA